MAAFCCWHRVKVSTGLGVFLLGLISPSTHPQLLTSRSQSVRHTASNMSKWIFSVGDYGILPLPPCTHVQTRAHTYTHIADNRLQYMIPFCNVWLLLLHFFKQNIRGSQFKDSYMFLCDILFFLLLSSLLFFFFLSKQFDARRQVSRCSCCCGGFVIGGMQSLPFTSQRVNRL